LDFTLSDDHKALQDAARRLFAERLPPERLRELGDAEDPLDAVDAKLWSDLVGLGWVGVTDLGGDFTLEAILLEEAGYALAPVPLLSTTVASAAAHGVDEAGGASQAAATVAWAEPDDPDRGGAQAFGPPDQVRLLATRHDGSDRLDGRKVDVPDMQLAETVLVLAQVEAGGSTVPALCMVRRPTADDPFPLQYPYSQPCLKIPPHPSARLRTPLCVGQKSFVRLARPATQKLPSAGCCRSAWTWRA